MDNPRNRSTDDQQHNARPESHKPSTKKWGNPLFRKGRAPKKDRDPSSEDIPPQISNLSAHFRGPGTGCEAPNQDYFIDYDYIAPAEAVTFDVQIKENIYWRRIAESFQQSGDPQKGSVREEICMDICSAPKTTVTVQVILSDARGQNAVSEIRITHKGCAD